MTVTSNLGLMFLAIGLVVYGISLATTFAVPPLAVALWAILTGVLILVGR